MKEELPDVECVYYSTGELKGKHTKRLHCKDTIEVFYKEGPVKSVEEYGGFKKKKSLTRFYKEGPKKQVIIYEGSQVKTDVGYDLEGNIIHYKFGKGWSDKMTARPEFKPKNALLPYSKTPSKNLRIRAGKDGMLKDVYYIYADTTSRAFFDKNMNFLSAKHKKERDKRTTKLHQAVEDLKMDIAIIDKEASLYKLDKSKVKKLTCEYDKKANYIDSRHFMPAKYMQREFC